jgi:hypothetical protein
MKKKIFFASFKSTKKKVGSKSQKYDAGDPDPHQNRTDTPTLIRIFFDISLPL